MIRPDDQPASIRGSHEGGFSRNLSPAVFKKALRIKRINALTPFSCVRLLSWRRRRIADELRWMMKMQSEPATFGATVTKFVAKRPCVAGGMVSVMGLIVGVCIAYSATELLGFLKPASPVFITVNHAGHAQWHG